jgi:hypothetical protein
MAEFDKKEQLGMPGYVALIRMAGQSIALFGTVGTAGGTAWALLSGQFQYVAPLSQAMIACTSVAAGLRWLDIDFNKD